jgi:4-amino-4-deoxy-L-arabinose transferase-like glycosyltransferase
MSSENDAAVRDAAQVQDVTAVRHEANAWRWLAAVLAYFLAYLLIRINLPGALDRDEAEIVYLTQELRLGYGTQPPLYAWLQWLAFSAFGVNRFALVVIKSLPLCAAYVAMYWTARPLVGRHPALAAAAALALFPQIGWETLRIQTHSILLLAIASATLGCYFALLRRPSLARYLVLGLLCGLGLQTKYNFGILLAGIAGASLMVPEHRRVVWNSKTGVAAMVALLAFLPHATWMLDNLDQAFGGTVDKMRAGMEATHYLARVAGGVLGVLLAAVSFAALPVLVFVAAGWQVRKQLVIDRRPPASRFFLAMYGIFAILLAVLALSGQVGTIKERWMMPLLFALPLAAFVVLPALRAPAVCRTVRRAAIVAALFFLALLPARIWLAPAFGMVAVPYHPYAQLAAELQRRCPAAQTVVTESLLSAGNLRFERPGLRTVLLDEAARAGTRLSGQVMLVTHLDPESRWPRAFLAAYPGARPVRQERLRLALRFGSPGDLTFDVTCYEMNRPLQLPVLGK